MSLRDEAETLDEAELRLRLYDIQSQTDLLMRLNKKDLLILGKHYAIGGLEFYFDDGWVHGGKRELCLEIADKMVGDF